MNHTNVPYEVRRQTQQAASETACRLTRDLIDEARKTVSLEEHEFRDWEAVRKFLENRAFHHHRSTFTVLINNGLQDAGFDVWDWPYPNVSSIHCDCFLSACQYMGDIQKASIPEADRALSRIVFALRSERDLAARSPLFCQFLQVSGVPCRPMCEKGAAEVGDPGLGRLVQLGMLIMRGSVAVIPSGPDEKDQARQNVRETVLHELRSSITGYRHPTSGWIETRTSELSAGEEKMVAKAAVRICETA